ncbi:MULTISPECIES: polysaccharide deacetylase family protein [unclassified Methylobacterium]|uniref:polysaccharide deacetylase family protein n=1 Tax=unclassified Methylobacterium TaxID=2615210 RepID=UPI002269A103|nr:MULTISPECIES: polysaccharide deacetylase family protein [unclassified Methylobacterium]
MQYVRSSERAYRAALMVVAICSRALHVRGQLILCLHSVTAQMAGDSLATSLSVTDQFLEDLIQDCARKAVPIVSLREALERWQRHDRSPFLVITFDDGYRDLYVNGFPVFKRHSVPFTVFVTTGIADRLTPMWWHALELAVKRTERFNLLDGPVTVVDQKEKNSVIAMLSKHFLTASSDRRRHLIQELAARNKTLNLDDAYGSGLDWNMIKIMHDSGLAEIGAHSVSHSVFANLDCSSLEWEISKSRDRLIEMTGIKPRYFAYPFGQNHEVGKDAHGWVESCGFEAAFSTNQSLLCNHSVTDRYCIPRLVLSKKGQDVTVVQAYMSGWPQMIRQRLAI